MIPRILPVVFAAAWLAAPAAILAQPPQDPAGAPAAGAERSDSVVVLSEIHRQDDRDAQGAAHLREPRDGQFRVYTMRPGGGTYEIRTRNGMVYRLDRDDGGLFVVNDKDGVTYRVGRGDGGVLVLRARDGRTYRVDGESRRAFVVRVKDGIAERHEGGPLVLQLRRGDGHAYRLSALETCGGAEPLVDRSSPDGHRRTVICGDHGPGAAGRIAQLEDILARMRQMEGLSESNRERVVAALREAIDQLRNTR